MRSEYFPVATSIALAFPLACAACTDIKSADLRTAGMSAYMTVVADGSGQTTATTQLNVDNNATDFVTLSSGDSLVASVSAQSRTMVENNSLGDVSYAASFSGADSSGAEYTVAFHRNSDVSAPDSTCSLPPPCTISTPPAGSTFSRAKSDIVVDYGPGGSSDAVTYSLSGDCVSGPTNATMNGDPGTLTLSRGSILPVEGQPANQACDVTLTVSRTRFGTLDPAFGSGGQIKCVQTHSIVFTSTP